MQTNTKRAGWPTWADWLVFALLACIIAASNWPAISANNIEIGDFAANSLLVQDAKSLKLIYGNYSRVGFNHPGPAFLYVLAAGEMLFHDVLHVLSPLSGQLMAVALLSAAWLTGLMRMIRRGLQSAAGAALFVGVFMLALALLEHNILSGLWFPHMYVLPFSVLLVAAATLVQGRTDSILPLAISTGFLINGHVSFVPIVAIVMVGVLVVNRLAAHKAIELHVVSLSFLRAHRRAWQLYVGIVAAFLLPFLIANIIDRPTPVQQYLAFSQHTKSNTIGQAIQYVAAYWNVPTGLAALAAVVALLFMVAARRRLAPAITAAAGGLLAAMAGGTLGLLYYAKVGIDMLDMPYIGMFYVAVPGLALASAVAVTFSLVPGVRRYRAIAWTIAIIAIGVCYNKIARPPDYASQFRVPGLAAMFNAVSALHPQGRIVLDVDDSANGANNWATVLGLRLYARRHGADLFCVNANWTISYTKAARCTPAELATAPRYFIHESGTAPASLGKAAVDQLSMGLYPMVRPEPIGFGPMTVKDQPQAFSGYFLQRGWSVIGGDFTWSLGKESGMAYALPAGFKGNLIIDAMGFVPKDNYVQEVEVLVDGKRTQTVRFTSTEVRKQFVVPVADNGTGLVTIALRYANAISPAEAGLSGDTRMLALALYGIELKKN